MATRPPKECATTRALEIESDSSRPAICSAYSGTPHGAGGSPLWPWPGKSTVSTSACSLNPFSMNEKMEPSHPQPCRSKMVGPFAFAAFV